MAAGRTFTAGHFMLDLGDFQGGFIQSFEGGTVKAEVATHNLGVSPIQRKHISNIKFEPFKCKVGMGMAAGFYEWIRQSFLMQATPKDGAILIADFDYKVRYRREFFGAMITSVTFPTFDASNKDPAYMEIEFEAERIVDVKGGGEQLQGDTSPGTKRWLNSNFTVDFGTELPTGRLQKVEGLKWTQKITQEECGPFRTPLKHPSSVELADVKMTMSMADADPWFEWHKSFVVDGNCGPDQERTYSLECLDPSLQEVLATFNFGGVGITNIDYTGLEANKEGTATITVGLYQETCEPTFSNTSA